MHQFGLIRSWLPKLAADNSQHPNRTNDEAGCIAEKIIEHTDITN